MLINKRCTVCHERIDTAAVVTCGDCQRSIHQRCQPYETQYECPDCATELEIGVQEF